MGEYGVRQETGKQEAKELSKQQRGTHTQKRQSGRGSQMADQVTATPTTSQDLTKITNTL